MFEILSLLFNLLTLKLEYNINDESLKLSESYSIKQTVILKITQY